MKKIILIVILLFVLIFSKNAFAVLKINEIYPAPSIGEDEWVEIYNDENNSVNIQNFYLTDSSGKKILITDETLGPYSFTIASTPSGVLNNSNQTGKNYADIIYLYDTNNQSIDIATYSGTFDSNKTYTKCPDGNGNWFVLNILTKNATNETACQILTPTPTPLRPTGFAGQAPTLTENPSPTETSTPQSYDNIYLSEVMANPVTGENEWVEIYNDNDFSVSLNNWFIDDLENAGSSPKIFSLEINAKGYGIFNLTSSMFNNDGDSVRLLDLNKNLKDDFEYQKTETGKTLGRIDINSDDFCLQEPSKNSPNNPCINPTPTPLLPTQSGSAGQAPTKIVQTKAPVIKANNFNVSIHRSINYPTGVVKNNSENGDVLGLTDNFDINSPSNKSFINLLCFLSVFYSILAIVSILIKNKVLNKYALAK